MRLLVIVVAHFLLNAFEAEQNTYRAAVLEYPPLTDGTPIENFEDNLKEILHFIRDAANQKAQIIVIPEYALSGMDVNDKDLEDFSTLVPDSSTRLSPCTSYNSQNISTTLRDLSCAAQTHRIYVVVNLIEKVVQSTNSKPIYYNTDLVFNRNGEIIARYHKINLFEEPYVQSGNQIVTFTTDFGVTFGLFTCFDMMFKMPSFDILSSSNVTDIVFPTAWFSYYPFYHSLTTQHAFAKTYGVNLLAAGMSNPLKTNGGSGIYFADGRVAETFISGTPVSRLIVQDVPKIASRTPNTSCKSQKSSGSYEWGVDPISGNISGFQTIKLDMSNFTVSTLDLAQHEIHQTICSGTSHFCCSFDITVSRAHNVQPNYVYKLAAFQGTAYVTTTKTLGVRSCGIITCSNDDIHTCGDRKAVPPKGVTFEKIAIKTSDTDKSVKYQPVTVTFDLKPATDYTFCGAEDNGNGVSITTSKPHETLMAFGLTSRVESYDNLPAGAINSASRNIFSVSLILASFGVIVSKYV